MLISIIVPIYNSEKYLAECIESITKQTYKNIELILINDGSADNSQEICEEYAKKDNRIIVINQSNSGVSASRNKGIEMAKGDYILFIDSDDIIDKRYVEILTIFNPNNKYSLNICKIEDFQIEVKDKTINEYSKKILEKNDFIKLYKMSLMNSCCGKLYNKKLITNNGIYFDETISLGEDVLFNLEYFKHTDIITVFDLKLYYYRINEKEISLSRIYNENFNYISTIIFDKIENTFQDTSNQKELYRCLYYILLSSIQNDFNNKNIGFWNRVKRARKTVSDKNFKDRLIRCKKYIKKSDYYLLKYKCIILYKILFKIREGNK